MKIKAVHGREILDSRGNPTVEADVILDDGTLGRASAPSGASTGSNEAHELRDGDKKRYGGKGVLKAVENIAGDIAKAVVGKRAADQRGIDEAMREADGTENKGRLGANAILAVSLAAARAVANADRVPLYLYLNRLSSVPRDPILPLPLANILNGGAHTNWETTDVQEFMVAPIGAPTFREGVRAVSEIFYALKATLAEKKYATSVGDEGGFAPALLKGNEEALSLMAEAVSRAGYSLGVDVAFALDSAASELGKGDTYELPLSKKKLSPDEMISWYESLAKKFPIRSIEDGLGEGDWDGWKKLTERLGGEMQLVGDDLLVTNVKYLERAISEKAGNAILVKPNQIGTLTETIDAVDMAHNAGWRAIISHRSGETEDTFIAHLAVGLGTGQIKTGSVSRSDRTAKYNELLRIESELGESARFAGNAFSI